MRFLRGLLSFASALVIAASAGATPYTDVVVQHATLYTTFGDPSNYVVAPGTGFDGVVDIVGLDPGAGGCIRGSGALVSGPNGDFILTAAHLADGLIVGDTNVFFDLAGGRTSIRPSAAYVHPAWDPDVAELYLVGYDIALLKLASPAPADAERYSIYRGSAEEGAVGEKAGYGRSGTGDEGDVLSSGTKRAGENRYDSLADILGDTFEANSLPRPLTGAQLVYDFDNDLEANDAFGYFFGVSDTGLLDDEVFAASGDSGGPTFLDGKIAGITSYGLRLAYVDGSTSDVDGSLNSSFGEFSVDTRVSYYADWVDSVVIPEPVTMGGMLLGMLALVRYVRRRHR